MVVVLKLVDVNPDMAGSIAVLDRVIGYWSLILVGLILYGLRLRRDLRRVVSRMTKQRLLIDASAGFNQGAGIGRYAREILRPVWPDWERI